MELNITTIGLPGRYRNVPIMIKEKEEKKPLQVLKRRISSTLGLSVKQKKSSKDLFLDELEKKLNERKTTTIKSNKSSSKAKINIESTTEKIEDEDLLTLHLLKFKIVIKKI